VSLLAGIEVSTKIPGDTLVKLSTMASILNRLPFASASERKSIDQTSFTREGPGMGTRGSDTRLLLVLFRSERSSSL